LANEHEADEEEEEQQNTQADAPPFVLFEEMVCYAETPAVWLNKVIIVGCVRDAHSAIQEAVANFAIRITH